MCGDDLMIVCRSLFDLACLRGVVPQIAAGYYRKTCAFRDPSPIEAVGFGILIIITTTLLSAHRRSIEAFGSRLGGFTRNAAFWLRVRVHGSSRRGIYFEKQAPYASEGRGNRQAKHALD